MRGPAQGAGAQLPHHLRLSPLPWAGVGGVLWRCWGAGRYVFLCSCLSNSRAVDRTVLWFDFSS